MSDGDDGPPRKARRVDDGAEGGASPMDILRNLLARRGAAAPAAPAAPTAAEDSVEAAGGIQSLLAQAQAALTQSQNAEAGAAAEEDQCRAIPEGFPSEFVCRRDECFEVVFDDGKAVKPHFVHQALARDDLVIGYKNLSIRVTYTPKWRALLEVRFDAELDPGSWDPELFDRNLVDTLRKSVVCPADGASWTEDKATFDKWREEDGKGALPGQEALGEAAGEIKDGEATLSLVRFPEVKSDPAAQELLHRLQAVSAWFIETAEQTDATDNRWFLYVLMSGATIVGFISMFRFHVPVRAKAPETWRLCQALVAPSWWGRRLGQRMVEAVYKDAIATERVFEMTVEDPCPAFCKLRDCVETALCRRYLSFPEPLESFPDGLVPREKREAVRTELKLPGKRVQRCYEILRFAQIKDAPESEAAKALRLDVKRRMYRENLEDVASRPREELKSNLALLFGDLADQYGAVVAELDKHGLY